MKEKKKLSKEKRAFLFTRFCKMNWGGGGGSRLYQTKPPQPPSFRKYLFTYLFQFCVCLIQRIFKICET